MVIFALMIPMIFAMGAVVIDLGNWYVHKRHLQTQVDAAVLAAATKFSGCSTLAGDPVAANDGIKAVALAYAGDTARVDEAEGAATTNRQLAEPDDAHVVLNSGSYWAAADGTDPDVPAVDSGYGLDYTMAPIDSQGNPAPDSKPCSVRAVDAKATDDKAPRLWGLIPITASPKSHARVEIYQVLAQNGMLPFAVPEVEPAGVAAIFVDELFASGQGAVVGTQRLIPDSTPPDGQYSYWTTNGPDLIDIDSEATSVVILLSKDNPVPTLTTGGPGTLQNICSQDPGKVRCYAGSTPTSGVNFIHGWSDAAGGQTNPQIRDVSVTGCSGPAAPYFVNLSTACTVGVAAVVDFQFPGDPQPNPPVGIDAQVRLYASANCSGSGDPLTWQSTDPGTLESIWEGGSKQIATESGRNTLSIGWRADDGPGPAESGCFGIVGAPYAADAASGPLEYVDVDGFDAPPTIDPNSRNILDDRNIVVTVGLPKPLALEDPLLPPRLIRFKGQGAASISGALDCDSNQPGHPWQFTFKDEIEHGCLTTYMENFVDPDGPNGPLPKQWDDITCSAYPSPGDLPPMSLVNDPPPNCVQLTQGQISAFRQGLAARFESPCTPNHWPTKPASPADDPEEVDDFMREHDFENDPRYVTLVVTDDSGFTGSNVPVPIKYFAGFYITRYDISSGGGGATQGCAGEDDPTLAELSEADDNGHLWGHFVKQVFFPAVGDPAEQLCNFDDVGTCIAVLVE